MDELKKYLRQHADELDLDEPRPQVWQQIRNEVAVKRTPGVVMLVARWTAAACLLALAGIGGWSLLRDQPRHQQAARIEAVPLKVQAVPLQPHETKERLRVADLVVDPEASGQHLKATYLITKRKTAAGANRPDLRAFSDLESSFTQVINLQRARVSTMPMYAETPEYFSDFKVQLRQMEKDERQIRAVMVKHGVSSDLLNQLIDLYQQKLNILKQLQLEMNKTNNRFKQSRGPVDSTRTYFLNI